MKGCAIVPYVHINELDNSTYYSNLYKNSGKPSNLRDAEYKQTNKLVKALSNYGIRANANEPIEQILNKFKLIDLNHSSVYYKFTSYYNRPHFKYDDLKTKPLTIHIEATNSVSNDCIRSVYLKYNAETGNYIGTVNYKSGDETKSAKFEYVNLYDAEHKQVLFDFSTLVVTDTNLSNISWSELNDFSYSGDSKITWASFSDTSGDEGKIISSVSETDLTGLYFAENTVYNVVFECMPKFTIDIPKGVPSKSIHLVSSNLSTYNLAQIIDKFEANDVENLQTTNVLSEAYLSLTKTDDSMIVYLHMPIKYNVGAIDYKHSLTIVSSDAVKSEIVGEQLNVKAKSLTLINIKASNLGPIDSCTTLINCDLLGTVTFDNHCIHAYNTVFNNVNFRATADTEYDRLKGNFYNCSFINSVIRFMVADILFEYCQLLNCQISKRASDKTDSLIDFNNCAMFNVDIDGYFKNKPNESNFIA